MDTENAKKASWLFLVAGLILIAINHWSFVDDGRIYLWAVLIGPTALLLGLAGVIDPRIVLAAGKYGKSLPVGLKVVAFGIVLVGFTVSAVLALFVYRPL